MENLFNFIQTNFPILLSHKYLFLFVGAALEGMSTIIIGGFLFSARLISFFPALAVFILGQILNSYIWYAVGYYTGSKSLDKWGRSKERSRRIIEKVEKYFHRHSGKALFITKFTFSLATATQIMAGSLKYDLKKYSLYSFINSVCWSVLAMSVGYFFGQSYKLFLIYVKDLAYGIIFLGGAMGLIYFLRWVFDSVFIKSLFVGERLKKIGDRLKNRVDKILGNGEHHDGSMPL